MSESEQFYTSSGPVSAEVIWQTAKADLYNQVTTPTYSTYIAPVEFVSYADGVFALGVQNTYVRDWLEHRLKDVVLRQLTAVAGRKVDARFVPPPRKEEGDAGVLELESEEAAPEFPGFEPFRTNFVQTPKQYFEIVLRDNDPVVAAFVGAVIAETIGVILKNRTSERREWWEASYSEIGRAAGIKSKASVIKAVRTARQKGYVIRTPGHAKQVYKYRLRDLGEPIDTPRRKVVR